MGTRRYPGALPFNSEQEKIFYGRDKDIEKLLTLIQVEKQVLLYSKSGLGKTSLLEAGVIPKLPENFVPISVRFYAYSQEGFSPVERIIEALKRVVEGFEEQPKNVLENLIENHQRHKTLWYYFKRLQLAEEASNNDKQGKVYVLFFDQFEELFTYPEEQIEEFKTQYYELTRLNVPDNIARLISLKRRKQKEIFNRKTISSLHKKNEVKTIFAIRSDRLSLLNNLSDKITDIQITFYEINPLDARQARDAIVKPALDPDIAFETRPFEFDKKAVDKIINELTEDSTHNLETTQLQIVCQRLEDIALQKQTEAATNKTVQIKIKDLPEFKNIFLNFYNYSISKIPVEQRDAAKRLIEDELIRNRQRLSLDENICKDYVKEETLKILVNTHLLRAEQNTFQRFSYELSHDTLVEPILESQKKYKEEQAAIKAEEERKEELRILKEEQERKEAERQRKIKQQRKLIRWSLIFSAIVVVVGVIAVVMGIRAVSSEKEAKLNAKEAEKQTNRAVTALDNLRSAQYEINFKEGKDYMKSADYIKAAEKFKNAYEIKKEDSARILRDSSMRQNALKEKYENIKKEAVSYSEKKEFIKSMEAYNAALETGYNNYEINRARSALKKEALKVYRKDLQDYQEWNDQEMIALTNYRINRMLNL